MIVGILIFLSFSGSLFQGTNPIVEIEKCDWSMLTMNVEELQRVKNELENRMRGSVVSAQNLTQELVELQRMKNELENRMTQELQSLQMKTE